MIYSGLGLSKTQLSPCQRRNSSSTQIVSSDGSGWIIKVPSGIETGGFLKTTGAFKQSDGCNSTMPSESGPRTDGTEAFRERFGNVAQINKIPN